MDIPCSNPGVQCESQFGTPNDPFLPEGNFSSEAPDAVRYFRTNYGSWRFPPLGSRWYSPTCWGMASSTISQADADAQAMNANTLCLSPQWPQRQPNPSAPDPGQPPYYYPDRQVFGNRFQMCFYTCPDGSVASFGVRAGYILGFSQAGADARAYSFACRQVSRSRMCLSNLSATYGCTGSDFEALIVSSTRFAPVQFSVSSGTLPPGLAFAVTGDRTATISGIPATAGTYVFGVTATDAAGVTITRQYTLKVVGISTQLLPTAALDSPYSATLYAEGPIDYAPIWNLASGSLPDGLSLNQLTGEISGVPTDSIDATFLISMNSGGFSCRKEFTINFVDADDVSCIVTPPTLPEAPQLQEYSGSLQAADSPPEGFSYNYTVVSGALPDGISLSLEGEFSGIPTTLGSYSFCVEVTLVEGGGPT